MKNWFVSIEQKTKNPSKGKSKSLDSSINYLLSKKHKSHFYSEITDLENARLSRANILDEYDDMRQKHSKGVKNVASSFVLSLPSDLYHPSVEEWRDISNMTIKNFVENINNDLEKKQKKHFKKSTEKMTERQLKEYNLDTDRFRQRLDLDEVKKLSTAVIHDESNKPLSVGETAGSHLNIVMSNIFNGEVIKHISQLGGVLSMKNAYSQAVKEKLDLDCDLYIPYSQRKEGEELKNFYTGETNNLKVVEVDEKTPHKNKYLVPDEPEDSDPTDPNNKLKLQGTKPFWVCRLEQSQAQQAKKIKLEEYEKLFNSKKNKEIKNINSTKKQVKKAISEVKTARKEIKLNQENIRDEKSNIAFDKKQIDFKNEELDQKISIFEKVKDLYETTQAKFKKWAISLHTTQKKELEKLAIASADTILELEKQSPAKANVMTLLAKNEEEKAKILGEIIKDTEKVSHQVKTRRGSNNKRSGNRI